MSVPTKPGNIERGWNDPPVFLHSVTDSKPGESVTPGKRTLLTKRVAHAGLYGNTTNNPSLTNSQQSDSSANLPPLVSQDGSKSSDSVTGHLSPNPDNVSPQVGVVLLPPSSSTELPKYTAPIIVPTMSPVDQDPGLGSPTATNPITNTQINLEDAENSLGMPNFDNDEQMFHYVMAKLQKTLIDVQGTLQPRVVEDVNKKLEILSSMWNSGAISYPVKCSMTRLATALHQRKCDEAHQIHMALMMDSVSEVGQWMVGVKRLIQEARNTQAPLGTQSTTDVPGEPKSNSPSFEPVPLLNAVGLPDNSPLLTVNASPDSVAIPPVIGGTPVLIGGEQELSKQLDNMNSNAEQNRSNETESKTDQQSE